MGARRVFVGRERELAELGAGLSDALDGHGRLFLVAGEPGIGKTHLIDELAAHGRARGMRVLWGRSWDGGGAPANWPWVQILRALAGDAGAETLRDHLGHGGSYVAQLVPEVRRYLPDLPEPPDSLEPERDRFHLFDAVTTFLRSVASAKPLLIALDDLHSADVASLLLLQFLAREIRDSRLLMVGMYRDTEARGLSAVGQLLGEIVREGRVLHLGGLSEAEVGRLIAASAGSSAAAQVVAAVHQATDGNPFFVDGVVRLLLASPRGLREPTGVLRIPDEVRESIRRRLRPFGDEAKALLALASVLGPEFDLPVLESATGLTREGTLDVVDELRAAAIIEPDRSALGRYRFTHALIRETLYDGLPPGRRVELHRRVAEIFEDLYRANPEPHLSELSHHFFEAIPAGCADKAIDYALQAGRRAMAAFAPEEAIKELGRARGVMDLTAADDPRRLGLLLDLGAAVWRINDRVQSREIFLQAAKLAGETGKGVELARAAIGFTGDLGQVGEYDDTSVEILERALTILDARDSSLRARLLASLARQLRFTDQFERRRSLCRQALQMARSVGEPGTIAFTLCQWHRLLFGTDSPFEQGLAVADEILRLARQAGDKDMLAWGHTVRIMSLFEEGNLTSLEIEIESYAALARQISNPFHVWFAAMLRCSLALMVGRFEDAERLAQEALLIGHPGQGVNANSGYGSQMFHLRWEQGRIGELEAAVAGYAGQYPRMLVWRISLAVIYADTDREAEARNEFERLAANHFADVPKDFTWTIAVRNLCLVCAFLGDARRAGRLYEMLFPYAGRNIVIGWGAGCVGSADHYLGMMAATMGRWDDAARHFERAIEMNSRMNAMPLVARSRFEYARVLLARDDPADRGRAVDLLTQALGVARKLGMKRLEERADALLRSGVRAMPPPLEEQPRALPDRSNVFRREGEFWTIAWQGNVFRLKDVKGLRLIQRLMQQPGSELHCAELAGEAVVDGGAGDALLDAEARVAYRRRLGDLREELEEAERHNDPGRAETARGEIECLSRELSRAVGLGGRARRASKAAERARLRVTRRIKDAITSVREYDPSLAHHLSTTVQTGTFCRYVPDPRTPVSWIF